MKATKAIMAGAVAAIVAALPAAAQTVLLRDARVYTMAGGAGVLDEADVLIDGGVIAAVGADLAAPAGARVINAKGRVVTPGLFAPWSSLGLAEIGLDDESNDSSPNGEFPYSASLDAADGFNPASSLIPVNRAGGVTRAIVAPEPAGGGGGHAHDDATASSPPAPGGRLFGGAAALVDLAGGPQSIVRTRIAQSAALGYAGAAASADTRLGAWAAFEDYLAAAASYRSDPAGFARTIDADRYAARDLAALQPVVAGAQPLIVSVNRAAEIRKLIRLKAERGLNLIVLGGAEAHLVARELAAARIPVILNPLANLPDNFERLGSTLSAAAQLNRAGVLIAFFDPPSGSHNLRLLPQLAGNAVAHGLPHTAGVAALTINPARMFGVADRYGSIEVGKAADVVVWDGDPLEVTTRPLAVFIDGRAQPTGSRQKMLRDRYRDLSRGALPPPYRGAGE